MPQTHLYSLDQIQPSDRSWVGDKAFYLSLLSQRGYPTLPGVVVADTAFKQFMESINWLEPLFADLPNSSLYLDVDDPRQLQIIAQQIQQAIHTTSLPEQLLHDVVEVVQQWHTPALYFRPSIESPKANLGGLTYRTTGLLGAHASWCHPKAIASALRAVWQELFRAKSLLFWQRMGIELHQINLAVLIQPLWAGVASGDLKVYSDHLDIRACWGMGEALVAGEVNPDHYVIQLPSKQLRQQTIGFKPCAYGLSEAAQATVLNSDSPPSLSCLERYPTLFDQTHQPCLDAAQVEGLADLSMKVLAELETPVTLEWLLYQPEGESSARLFISQINLISHRRERLASPAEPLAHVAESDRPSPHEPSSLPLTAMASAPLLRGLAAAHGRVIARAFVVRPQMSPSQVPAGSILVAPTITPDWTAQLKQMAAVITDQGGTTSHGAIVARELGVPAVVSTGTATRHIKSGDVLLVDGDRGLVYRLSESDVATTSASDNLSAAQSTAIEPTTYPTTATPVWVNLSQVEAIDTVADLPVEAIGLLRSELMIRPLLKHQSFSHWVSDRDQLIEQLVGLLQPFAQRFFPRPVFYRSLDLRSHELSGVTQPEINPILGLHGALSYQHYPAIFEAELAALYQLQQMGLTNLNLLLPFVRTVEEFQFCRQRVLEAGLTRNPHFQLWIMAEVPSVLFLLPDYVHAGVQGISIGCNDLTQLILGIDRDHPLDEHYNPRHPAVVRAMQQIVKTARQEGISCSICGQGPSQFPELIDLLVRWGVTSISVSPDAVKRTIQAIARAERNLLIETVRSVLEETP